MAYPTSARSAVQTRRVPPALRSRGAVDAVGVALVGALALGAAFASPSVRAAPVERILDDVPVSASQVYASMTPLAVRDGEVFIAFMRPGPNGDGPLTNDLRIEVRHGTRDGAGNWSWTGKVVEDRGVYDRWHTAPSIGVDDAGHVHVAYNMHNFPWQYQVSSRPMDIGAFDFRGQAITQAELDLHTFENRTGFPDLGTAAIPGNQITYPAFDTDPFGRLHLTYRFAAKPARRFAERTYSSGVARYDPASRSWTSLGGLMNYEADDYTGPSDAEATLRSVASRTGWTSYLPRLSFDASGAMTVSTLWRSGTAGSLTDRPCVVRTEDGERFRTLDGAHSRIPLLPGNCPNVDSAMAGSDYYSLGDMTADEAGHPLLLLSPVGRSREIHRWTGSAWETEPSPGNALEIFHDDEWNLWAVAEGPSLYLRRRGADVWETALQASSTDDCLPHLETDPADRSVAYAFTMDCTEDRIAVTRFDLRALRDGDPPAAPLVEPLALERARWRQVSLPFDSADMTPAGVFGTALPMAEYGQSWLLYGYDAMTRAYFQPPADQPLEAGRGYWMIQDVAGRIEVPAPADATPPPAGPDRGCAIAACTEAALSLPGGGTPGWNLGGAPIAERVSLADVRVASGGGAACRDGCALAQAAADGLVGPELFRYDASSGAYVGLAGTAPFDPWEGYWVVALGDAPAPRLLFPETVGAAAAESRAPPPVPDGPPPGPTRGPTPDDRAIDGA